MKHTLNLFLEGARQPPSCLLRNLEVNTERLMSGCWPGIFLFVVIFFLSQRPVGYKYPFFFKINYQPFHFVHGEIKVKKLQGPNSPKRNHFLDRELCSFPVFPQTKICELGLEVNLELNKVCGFTKDIKSLPMSQRKSTITKSSAPQILSYAMDWPKIKPMRCELTFGYCFTVFPKST